jgi:hypothetical protein
MTNAERQRRHRDIVTATPMTKAEREDLAKLIRNREKVMKTAAAQRSAQLLAEFEQQMASVYSYDQDEIWKQATALAKAAVDEASQQITARCEELGIPARFAPCLKLEWRGRDENAVRERRDELRAVAKSRIAAIEKETCTKIEMHCLDAQAQVLAHGLTTASAIAFFDQLPKVEMMMPALELPAIEDLLLARRIERVRRYTSLGLDPP